MTDEVTLTLSESADCCQPSNMQEQQKKNESKSDESGTSGASREQCNLLITPLPRESKKRKRSEMADSDDVDQQNHDQSHPSGEVESSEDTFSAPLSAVLCYSSGRGKQRKKRRKMNAYKSWQNEMMHLRDQVRQSTGVSSMQVMMLEDEDELIEQVIREDPELDEDDEQSRMDAMDRVRLEQLRQLRYLWVPQSTVDSLKSLQIRMRKAGAEMAMPRADGVQSKHQSRADDKAEESSSSLSSMRSDEYCLRAYSYHSVLRDELNQCESLWLSIEEGPQQSSMMEHCSQMMDKLLSFTIVAFDSEFTGWFIGTDVSEVVTDLMHILDDLWSKMFDLLVIQHQSANLLAFELDWSAIEFVLLRISQQSEQALSQPESILHQIQDDDHSEHSEDDDERLPMPTLREEVEMGSSPPPTTMINNLNKDSSILLDETSDEKKQEKNAKSVPRYFGKILAKLRDNLQSIHGALLRSDDSCSPCSL